LIRRNYGSLAQYVVCVIPVGDILLQSVIFRVENDKKLFKTCPSEYTVFGGFLSFHLLIWQPPHWCLNLALWNY